MDIVSTIIGVLITLFILSILVIIHEFGHFITAKKLGIKVEEFGFGFPPLAWSKKVGETVFSLNWIPVGGFVKLYGEDEAGGGKIDLKDKGEKIQVDDLDRAFFARPVWQRAVVVLAGVIMNAVMAFLIYYIFLGSTGFKTELPLLSDHKFSFVQQVNINWDTKNPLVTYIIPGSPASIVGIKAPAKIIAVNNQPVTTTAEIIKIIDASKGKNIPITWQGVQIVDAQIKTGAMHTSMITPRVKVPKNEGPTGIAFLPVAHLFYLTPMQKIFSGIVHPLNLMSYNFDVMGQLIKQSVKEKNAGPISEGVSGPVGIVSLGGEINAIPDLKERFLQFLNLAGILSISLAIFNVLPIPALDGGRLFFILLEGVIGKKVSPKVEGYVHSIGMIVLLGLVLLVTFKDVLHLFG